MKRIFTTILGLCLISNLLFSQQIERANIDIKYLQKIPMRDGINLSATICKPSKMDAPVPAIFILTPYTADRNLEDGQFYAKNNYVAVIVDTRGRGNSEGEITPFDTVDGRDGFDVCKWISKQPWCNGKIGMCGGSYLGMVQWQTLKEMPPNLKTIVPSASVGPGVDFPFRNNIFCTYLGPYFTFISGHTLNQNGFVKSNNFWNNVYMKHYKGEVPFCKLMESSNISVKAFDTWMQHTNYDDYWKKIQPTEKEYKQFNIPILTITGYYDDDQAGALNYYSNYMKWASEDAKSKHYLLIGPWDHGGTRRPQTKLEELSFGDSAVIDMFKLHLAWFNWILKDGKKPEFLKDRITYYVMNEDHWKSADKIENFSNTTTKLYLSSNDGQANDIFKSGSLFPEPLKTQKPDKFISNPLDTTYLSGYLGAGPSVNYAMYSNGEAYKKDQLIYHSAPLTEDILVNGHIKLNVYIEMDVKDADFEYILYEIKPDGKEVILTMDYMRARYRNSLEKEELVTPGKINKYELKTSYLISRNLTKGSVIRLVFRVLNSPHYEKNFNSGGDIKNETYKDAKTATIKLYHDATYPSYLEFPVLKK